MLNCRLRALLFLATFGYPLVACAGNYTYVSLDSTAGHGGTTRAWSINNLGQVVGQSSEAGYGFLYSGGVYTFIPGPNGENSGAVGINDAGQILGGYANGYGGAYGFVKTGDNYTIIDVPNSNKNAGTIVTGINNHGTVIGNYSTQPGGSYDAGFLESNGVYTTLQFPGGPNFLNAWYSGVNDAGQVVGTYDETVFIGPSQSYVAEHGFFLSGGVYTTLDVPGATLTEATGINNVGQITGWYENSKGIAHGFVLTNGVYVTLDFPGAFQDGYTQAYGINDFGQVVGKWAPAGYPGDLGFIATPGIGVVPEPSTFILLLIPALFSLMYYCNLRGSCA